VTAPRVVRDVGGFVVVGVCVLAALVLASWLLGCSRPTAPPLPTVEDAGPAPAPPAALRCECSAFAGACGAPYRCGVSAGCAVAYLATDAGVVLIDPGRCPVPIADDRGRVVVLCLEGDACVVDDAAAGGVVTER